MIRGDATDGSLDIEQVKYHYHSAGMIRKQSDDSGHLYVCIGLSSRKSGECARAGEHKESPGVLSMGD